MWRCLILVGLLRLLRLLAPPLVVVAAMTRLAQTGQVFGPHIPLVVAIAWPPIGEGNAQVRHRHHHFVGLGFLPAFAPGAVSHATPLATPTGALFDRKRDLFPVWRIAPSVPHHAAS